MPIETKVEDVVCDMMVEPDSYRFHYRGRDYAFCSAQCRERFEAHPHLYVGTPGHPAPKKQGVVVLKQRRFVVDRALDETQAKHLQAEINAMMGIKSLEVSGAEVVVTYDLLQATASQIEAELEKAGAHLGNGWGENLRRGFIHYTEECEIDNLQVSPSAGCH
ncbi:MULTISPECIES: YHS domain-containing protein [Candidatus Accumulibacter]|jgi:YHS domain-containing protein|uniref:YHS domain-containing protein n=1 Tax=Candidatus Accumulibacter TaxID=327159 RepID=UPI0025BD8315|nr:YHS domain-containing protein [Candidatus Accumulibacter sp. ACC007]